MGVKCQPHDTRRTPTPTLAIPLQRGGNVSGAIFVAAYNVVKATVAGCSKKEGRGLLRPFQLQQLRLHALCCCGRKRITDSLLFRLGGLASHFFFGSASARDGRSGDLLRAGTRPGSGVAGRWLCILRESGCSNDGDAGQQQ